MGHDAIWLRSSYPGHSVVERIKRQCLLRSGLDCVSGEILHELFTGELFGSWDSRISVIPRNEEWAVNKNERPEPVPCDPYILIEASVHKIKYGHSVYGAPNVFLEACRDLVALVEDLFETDLPATDWWTVRCVDVAPVYRLSKAACKGFFDGLQLMSPPYRKKGAAKYAMVAYFIGKTATVKFYYRGTEFQVYDRGRPWGFSSQVFKHRRGHGEGCSRTFVKRRVAILQRLADSRLRVEVEVYSDKLQYDFGKHPRVDEMTDVYLEGVFSIEIEKFLREEKQATTTV